MPLRFFCVPLAFVLCLGPARAADQSQLDASPSLFAVLAAINAAGYDADLDSSLNHPLRAEVREELAAKPIPCLEALKRFFQDHRQRDWTSELSQYISFALVSSGPPTFQYRLKQNEIPPDVMALSGFQELMTRFYREGGVEALWRRAQPQFETAIERYHTPVVHAVTEASGYLRETTGGNLGWRFQIYVDLLGAPNQIQTRSYGREYFVVVTPSPEPQTADVRHAYLHFLLDPLVTRHSDEIMKYKALGDYALAAPFLGEAYKSDFLLLVDECLVKAVESRLQPGSAPQKQALVQQALSEGWILTPHIAEQLQVYEAEDRAMRFFFPDLVSSINLKREERRLENVQFAAERPVRKVKSVITERAPELTGAQKALQEAEQLYAARDLDKAKQAYLRLLKEKLDAIVQAKAYYGLARIAALQQDPETAEQFFLRTLAASPDPQTGAWSHVYLGRLADLAGERDKATEHYKIVMAMEGASQAAREAAQKGLQGAFKKN